MDLGDIVRHILKAKVSSFAFDQAQLVLALYLGYEPCGCGLVAMSAS